MLELTGNANKTSEQQCELGVARITRDVKDLQIIRSWFTENYPFSEKAELMFISMGLTAPQDSGINCDKADEIGAKIYPLIIKHTHTHAKVSQKEKTVTPATLHNTLNIDNEMVIINPLILFSRLILLAEGREETVPCFEYELTNYPFTLFKNGMMRNGNKALLCSF